MDDYDDLADQYAQPPAPEVSGPPPQQAPPPMPFTQADSLWLQRLQQGHTALQRQLYEGEIDGDTYGQMSGQIMGQMQPLLARQQADKQQQLHETYDQLHQQAAMQAALQHTDSTFRAQGFPDTIRGFTDPLTGQTVHFYEEKPGTVRQIEWPDQGGAQAGPALNTLSLPPGAADQGTINYYPLGGMMQVGFGGDGSGQAPGNDATPDVSGAAAAQQPRADQDPLSAAGVFATGLAGGTPAAQAFAREQAADQQRAQAGQPPQSQTQDVQPAADGGHVMTIINGANQERWHFAPDGTTTLIGRQGPQADAARQQQQIDQLVPPHKIAALTAQAAQMFPDRSRGQYPAGPHGDAAFARDQNTTMRNRASFVNEQSRMLAQQAISQGTQQSIADRAKAAREAREAQQGQQQHIQGLKSGYIKDRLDVEKHVMEGFKSGIYQGSGTEVKDARDNVTGRMPTNDEWEQQVGKVLDSLGMARDVNEHLRRFGITLPGQPQGAGQSAAAAQPAGGQAAAGAGRDPLAAPKAITPEALALPSKDMTPERSQELANELASWKVEGGNLFGLIPSAGVEQKRTAMHSLGELLDKSVTENRSLTIGEHRQYEQALSQIPDERVRQALRPRK